MSSLVAIFPFSPFSAFAVIVPNEETRWREGEDVIFFMLAAISGFESSGRENLMFWPGFGFDGYGGQVSLLFLPNPPRLTCLLMILNFI